MIRTQVRLTAEQLCRLRRLAARKKVSVAELIRHSVDSYLEMTDEASIVEGKQQLLSIVGMGESDVADLSENHDRYLVEVYAEIDR